MAQAANVIALHNRDQKRSEAFRELEGDICDLLLMAKMAGREVEGALKEAAPGTDAYERGTFAILHLSEMIAALHARYYVEFEASR